MAGKGDRDQLIEHILELEEKVSRALGGPYSPKPWLRLNFTMPQFKILLLLFAEGPTRMSVLASRLGVSMATTTGIVERLVKQGVVQRESEPGDRRVVLCKLTPKGQKMMSEVRESGRIWARGFLEKVPPLKLELIAKAMEAILEAATTGKENSLQAVT